MRKHLAAGVVLLGIAAFAATAHLAAQAQQRALYVTALTSVYRLRTAIPGITPFTKRSSR